MKLRVRYFVAVDYDIPTQKNKMADPMRTTKNSKIYIVHKFV